MFALLLRGKGKGKGKGMGNGEGEMVGGVEL